MFFEGSTRFSAAKPLWKAWAPLKTKFTIWLAVHDRLWTSARRHRHGLQDSPACAFCLQEPETCDHLFHGCCFTRQIWYAVSVILGLHEFAQVGISFVDWWLQARRRKAKSVRKGIDSTVMLVSWRLWKQRNEQVFNNHTPTVPTVVDSLIEDAVRTQAGAAHLAALGWPGTA